MTTFSMKGSSMGSGRLSLLMASAEMEKRRAVRKTALESAPTTSTLARPSPTHSDTMSDSMLKESETSAMEFPNTTVITSMKIRRQVLPVYFILLVCPFLKDTHQRKLSFSNFFFFKHHIFHTFPYDAVVGTRHCVFIFLNFQFLT
uniref:Uncharacterized protein n=1 Tax=Pygocentrus nattereri TaxID=42514 RepID=A0A3B4DSC5_PYGNA